VGESLEDLGQNVPVRGVLTNTSGEPIPEAAIIVSIEGTPYEKEFTTDANGRFQVTGIADQELTLTAKKQDYRPQIMKVKLGDRPATLDEGDFVMKTLDEAYAEMGIERPKDEEPTPEEESNEFFNLAVDAYQQGNNEETERLALAALEKNPEQKEAYKLLAYANNKLKDWEDLLVYSEKYLSYHPDDQNFIQLAALAAEATNKKDKIAQYKTVLQEKGLISPDDLWNKAVDAINALDDDTAQPILQEILKMDDTYAPAYFELGKMSVRQGDFEDAVLKLKLFLKHADAGDSRRKEATDLIVTLSE
jgi:tetratricopeptide (TPR) repeat protein